MPIKIYSHCVLWTFALILSAAQATTGPREAPAALGFSEERLNYIDRFYAERVKRGDLAGVVLLVARHGKIAHFSAIGVSNIATKEPLRTDSLFRLYSMTKPIASTALMMLFEEGRFQLDDPIAKYLPEFANLKVLKDPDGPLEDTVPLARPPTIHDILRHTAGFTHGGPPDNYNDVYLKKNLFGVDVTLEQMMQGLATIPLRFQPGTQWHYSVGPDVAARLVEVLSGVRFDEFLERRLFKPLGMRDSGFWVPRENAKRLVSISWSDKGKLVPLDAAHHPSCEPFCQLWSADSYTADHKRKGGSFGLVSSAEDYWHFAQMMANGGVLDGARLLSPAVVKYMTRDHLGALNVLWEDGKPTGLGWGLGFAVLRDPVTAGFMGSEGSYFWHGAAGTTFWVDQRRIWSS